MAAAAPCGGGDPERAIVRRPDATAGEALDCHLLYTSVEGELTTAEPKRLRYAFLHAAGRIVHSGRGTTIRVQRHWPWEHEVVSAFKRMRALALC
jgi:hypothetical protein